MNKRILWALFIGLVVGVSYAQSWEYGTLRVGNTAEWHSPTADVTALSLQYLTQKLAGEPMGGNDPGVAADLQKLLTRLGRNGWDVVGTVRLGDGSTLLILERPAP